MGNAAQEGDAASSTTANDASSAQPPPPPPPPLFSPLSRAAANALAVNRRRSNNNKNNNKNKNNHHPAEPTGGLLCGVSRGTVAAEQGLLLWLQPSPSQKNRKEEEEENQSTRNGGADPPAAAPPRVWGVPTAEASAEEEDEKEVTAEATTTTTRRMNDDNDHGDDDDHDESPPQPPPAQQPPPQETQPQSPTRTTAGGGWENDSLPNQSSDNNSNSNSNNNRPMNETSNWQPQQSLHNNNDDNDDDDSKVAATKVTRNNGSATTTTTAEQQVQRWSSQPPPPPPEEEPFAATATNGGGTPLSSLGEEVRTPNSDFSIREMTNDGSAMKGETTAPSIQETKKDDDDDDEDGATNNNKINNPMDSSAKDQRDKEKSHVETDAKLKFNGADPSLDDILGLNRLVTATATASHCAMDHENDDPTAAAAVSDRGSSSTDDPRHRAVALVRKRTRVLVADFGLWYQHDYGEEAWDDVVRAHRRVADFLRALPELEVAQDATGRSAIVTLVRATTPCANTEHLPPPPPPPRELEATVGTMDRDDDDNDDGGRKISTMTTDPTVDAAAVTTPQTPVEPPKQQQQQQSSSLSPMQIEVVRSRIVVLVKLHAPCWVERLLGLYQESFAAGGESLLDAVDALGYASFPEFLKSFRELELFWSESGDCAGYLLVRLAAAASSSTTAANITTASSTPTENNDDDHLLPSSALRNETKQSVVDSPATTSPPATPSALQVDTSPSFKFNQALVVPEFVAAMQREYGPYTAHAPNWPSKANSFYNTLRRLSDGTSSTPAHEARNVREWFRRAESQQGKKMTLLLKAICVLGKSKKKKKKDAWQPQRIQELLLVPPLVGWCDAGASPSGSSTTTTTTSTSEAASTPTAAATAGHAKSPISPAANGNASPLGRRTNGKSFTLIETEHELSLCESVWPFSSASDAFDFLDRNRQGDEIVAIDCEGVSENLFLVQVGTEDKTYVFDGVKLGAKRVCEFLTPLLQNEAIIKLFHDAHCDAAAFAKFGGVCNIRGTFDTQLAAEIWSGNFAVGFNRMLEHLGLEPHPTKHAIKKRIENGKLFAQRPLPRDVLQYAVDDVKLLIAARTKLKEELGEEAWQQVQRASDVRAKKAGETGGERQISFDVANSYAIVSTELMNETRPGDVLVVHPLKVSNDTSTLLSMLPDDLSSQLEDVTDHLSDIVLDKGRKPLAWVTGKRMFLGDSDRLVEKEEIQGIVEKLGGFGSDNRAGLERQLHRVSAIRNRESEIIGLTMRVGRHISGNSCIIADLLFQHASSILFLGEPGSGKTTVIREVTRLLSERHNVCIVDTSNEIAGDGDCPHPCVGHARRMMVPSLDEQSAVMIECVQNHTPEIMVIDEIGRNTEVEAARTCKNRGVRLIASAHGDLRKLIKNPKLRGLIGGVESVTLGDIAAKQEAKRNNKTSGPLHKTKAERAGPPTFDMIIELKRGEHHVWRVVTNTANAVDRILDGQQYFAQRRTRDPATGAIRMHFDRA